MLVFANNAGLPGALPVDQMASALGLGETTMRPWHVQACNAVTGEGLLDGLNWLGVKVTGGARRRSAASPPPASRSAPGPTRRKATSGAATSATWWPTAARGRRGAVGVV